MSDGSVYIYIVVVYINVLKHILIGMKILLKMWIVVMVLVAVVVVVIIKVVVVQVTFCLNFD